jgi:hypothetical protein
MKMVTTKKELIKYTPSVELGQFRLTREPTVDALANDIIKLNSAGDTGMDMHIMATFLSGVTQIKLKKIVGNAKRGVHGGGEGWMKTKQEKFPFISERKLQYQVNFVKLVFAEFQTPKNAKVADLGFQDPADFQMPENPDELRRLLTAIHNVMDGKTITALYRSSGRIRDAIPAGSNSGGRRRLTIGEQAELAIAAAQTDWESLAKAVRGYRESFTLLTDTEVEAQIAVLEPALKARFAWLKQPKNHRVASAVVHYFTQK